MTITKVTFYKKKIKKYYLDVNVAIKTRNRWRLSVIPQQTHVWPTTSIYNRYLHGHRNHEISSL